jgi:hypothetical protein
MEQLLEKKEITPILKSLEIGESENYPKSQYTSLLATLPRLRIQYNLKFSTSLNENSIKITRIE